MTLSPADRREAISSLASSTPFQLFCDYVEETLEDITAEMVRAKTDAELLRTSRMWQVYFKYLHLMRTVPASLRDEALREIEEVRQGAANEDAFVGGLPWGRAQLLRQIESQYENRQGQGEI